MKFDKWYQSGYWDDHFIPYMIVHNDIAVSSVAVCINDICWKDQQKRYVQISTVMTLPEYRNKGLNRYLMEAVLNEWKEECDAIYLLSNDSVVDYYPKFGFEEFTEFQYSKTIIKTKGAFRKLDSAEFVDLGGENMGFGIGVYVKNSAKAVELYQQVFGLELGYHVKNPDGSFYHSELCRNGECFLSVVETTKDNADGSIVQLGYEFNCQEEVKRAYDLLKEGGRIDMPIGKLPWSSCAASIVDRFGVCWYLFSDSHRPPEDYDYWKEVH